MTATAPIDVFRALSDPLRVELIDVLGRGGAASATTLAADAPVSRQAVVKHLQVLRAAGLVTTRRRGQEVLFAAAPEQLTRSAAWLDEVAAGWDRALLRVKLAAETTETAGPPSS